MIVIYHPRFNFDLGVLHHLHPFDGRKFGKVYEQIRQLKGLDFESIDQPVRDELIRGFAGELLRRLLTSKRYILRALEVPYLPLIPFSVIDRRVLEPMRWTVAGTLRAAELALAGRDAWNLSGGYHHASRNSAEGFCIYNDIGIAVDQLVARKAIGPENKILLIDVDAHHGNGNAHVFMERPNVVILDVYNDDIYPRSEFTKDRVDVRIALKAKTTGPEYLERLEAGLQQVGHQDFRLAFVIAGTDVLASDPLGGLRLSVQDAVVRDRMIFRLLRARNIPFAFLGGGGYGKESATAISRSIAACYEE